jgi:ketosteroid isomerase-like protein
MTKLLRAQLLILLPAWCAPFAALAADSPTDLLDTIKKMDAAIFDAFNAHDTDRLMSYFTEDLEFYHDTGGLGNYRQNAEDFKKMFASTPDIRRELVPKSIEVYPIKDYGAMELGQHRFCHKENGKDDCGTFGFAMVWRKVGDSWKISRVLSYGHKPPGK